MPRPLTPNSQKILLELGKGSASLEELRARTRIPKKRLANTLWRLRRSGWVASAEVTRKLFVYRRVRLPAKQKIELRRGARVPANISALNAAFGIALPAKRPRARTVRFGGE